MQLLIHEKKCTTCKQTKSIDQFYVKSHHKDGLDNRCRDCVALYMKRWKVKDTPKRSYVSFDRGITRPANRNFIPSGKTSNKELDLYYEKVKRENLSEKAL